MEGAGDFFTSPLLIQHRSHYSRVSFELAPMADDLEIILPRWWLTEHNPSDLLSPTPHRIRFNSQFCRQNCSKEKQEQGLSMEWDQSVLTDKNAGYIGMVCAAPTESDLKEALAQVPEEFSEFIPIMTTEAASVLPEHTDYDHAIDLKPGTTPPWGSHLPIKRTRARGTPQMVKENDGDGSSTPLQILVFLTHVVRSKGARSRT